MNQLTTPTNDFIRSLATWILDERPCSACPNDTHSGSCSTSLIDDDHLSIVTKCGVCGLSRDPIAFKISDIFRSNLESN